MDKKTTTMLLLFLVFLGMAAAISNATVVSPPQKIQLEGGEEDNAGNWKGGYWTFTVAVDQADSLIGKVVLPANTSEKEETGTEVKTRKTVEIQITPQKAYYKRLLKLAPIEDRIVAPKAYRGGLNKILGTGWYDTSTGIDATVAEYYEWAEPSWEKYTEFKVSVYVEGQLVGESNFNTETGTKDMVINTSKGAVLIKNLGRLEGDFTEPQVPSEVVIFDKDYIFTSDAIQYIRYDHGRTVKYWGSDNSYLMYIENSKAFSTFWWGTVRWNPKSVDATVADTPAPFSPPGALGYDIISPGKGWNAADSFWDYVRDPVAPEIYQGDNSLMSYLNRMTSEGNIADKWLAGYNWHLEEKDDKPNAVIVDIPWGAYSGAPLVTFYVPTELADTFVYRPPISEIRIENATWVNNGTEIAAASKKKCQLKLKQYSNVLSSAVIYATTSTSRASVAPKSMTVTMAPSEIKTVTFEVSNLGVDIDTSGTVLFTVKRSWDGIITNTAQLEFKLLAPVMPDDMDDVTDRTGPTNPGPAKSDASGGWVWILAIVCGTAIVITLMVLIAKEKSYRDATKKIAKGTANLTKAAVRPFYQRNPGATTAFIMGVVVFFGLLLNMKWFPWFRVFPIDFGIPFVWEFHSDWFWIFGTLVGFIAMVGGGLKLLWSRTPPVIKIVVKEATKVAEKGTKKISDYFQKEEEE